MCSASPAKKRKTKTLFKKIATILRSLNGGHNMYKCFPIHATIISLCKGKVHKLSVPSNTSCEVWKLNDGQLLPIITHLQPCLGVHRFESCLCPTHVTCRLFHFYQEPRTVLDSRFLVFSCLWTLSRH